MIGRSISHWGIHMAPDTEFVSNIVFLQDGYFARLEDDEPSSINTYYPIWPATLYQFQGPVIRAAADRKHANPAT